MPKLASVLRISADAVYRWERGESKPTKKRQAQLDVLLEAAEVRDAE